jgi:hypothetical protein
MNKELQMQMKEAVVVKFKVLSYQFPAETLKDHETA